MAKKNEKKVPEKEVYRLWWEYLKRSDKYKIYCDAVRKVMDEARKKKGKEYLRKIEELILKEKPIKENKTIRNLFLENFPMDVLALKYIESNWLTFRDVFTDSFDDWWKVQQTMDFSVPMVVLNEPDAMEKLPYFMEECEEIKKEKRRDLTPQEVINTLIEAEYDYLFIALPMVGNVTMNEISKEIADLRIKWKEEFAVSDMCFRKFFMPVSRVRFDELKRYLKVYDLKQQGLKMKEIINQVDPNRRGDNVDVMRAFRNDLQKAKKVIKNVEYGFFPESPPDA